ncbi:MAG: exosortase/archaeosortase family protein [Desulfurococcales archaeon]|nr:exosortase/archaeosortase family protein [Desulfurococcales archaeon]
MRRPLLDTAIVAGFTVLLSTVYRDAVLAYIETMQIPDYSYLMILVPSTAIIIAEIINKHATLQELDIGRIVAAGGGLLIAFSLHKLSTIIIDYSLELELLSIITLLASMLFLVYGDFDRLVTPLAIWILLLLLVPLPRGILDTLSAELTDPVAKAASMLTGAQLTESYGFTSLRFVDSSGVTRLFQIAPECSGVVSLLSALSLAPIIFYLALTSNSTWRRKAKAIALSLALAVAIVFTGNILRVALVVYIAKTYDYKTALEFFHQTPSLIYTGIATIVALMITLRLPRPSQPPRPVKQAPAKIRGGDIVKAALITLIVLAGTINTPTTIATSQMQNLPTPEELIQNPALILYNQTTTKARTTLPSPLLGEALGALAVYRASVTVENKTLQGWIEIGETPARFHSWDSCLLAQNYKITKRWTESYENMTITYILAKKGLLTQLLAYTIVKYPTERGNLYVKISLFSTVTQQDYLDKAELLRKALTTINIPARGNEPIRSYFNELYLGLVLLAIALIAGLLYKTLNSKVKYISPDYTI